jgi:hypothetical protein
LPQTWFIAAFKGGKTKAIAVALMIWQRKAIERSLTVTVGSKTRKAWGIERNSYYRGLKSLERAGLVSVNSRRGAAAKITILHVAGLPVPKSDAEDVKTSGRVL